jgi:hypothetical protein
VIATVDLVDPASSRATAFSVRDGWFVPLRPIGWKDERDTAQVLGEVEPGREARGDDPLPVPDWMAIR